LKITDSLNKSGHTTGRANAGVIKRHLEAE